MLKFVKHFCDIYCHRDINIMFIAVPFESYDTVQWASRAGSDCVKNAKGVGEMVGMVDTL